LVIRFAFVALGILCLLEVQPAAAQREWLEERATLEPGSRIRLKTARFGRQYREGGGRYDYAPKRAVHRSDWITGQLVGMDARALHLAPAESNDTLSVARDSIFTVEVSLGTHNRKGTGKVLGMVIGAGLLGTLFAVLEAQSCEVKNPFDVGEIYVDTSECAGRAAMAGLLGIVVGGVGGYFLGGYVGSKVTYEKWEEIPGWGKRFSVSPQANPTDAGLRLGWITRF